MTLGVLSRCNLPHNVFVRGQQLADGLNLGLGAAAFIIGGGVKGSNEIMMATNSEILVPVAAPSSATGTAVRSYGVVIMGKALLEFSRINKYKGKK